MNVSFIQRALPLNESIRATETPCHCQLSQVLFVISDVISVKNIGAKLRVSKNKKGALKSRAPFSNLEIQIY